MKIALRIFLGFFLVVGLAAFFVMRVFVNEVKPGVRQAMENSLVDTAAALSQLAADDLATGTIRQGVFARAIERLNKKKFDAEISGVRKQRFEYRIYVTDVNGVVQFDSTGKDLGADYSQWNDVYLTLRGKYGARSTRDDPNDDRTSVMYVAAPVIHNGKIIGSLTVARPNLSLQPVIERSQAKILNQGWVLLGLSFLISLMFAWWLARALGKLTHYADKVSAGERAQAPVFGNNEMGRLSIALANMREKLDGKQYVEQYVHTLTHEMKSPLAAIRGASELLNEPLPETEQKKFLGNIQTQSQRLTDMVDRMLSLASLESQTRLEKREAVNLAELAQTVLDDLSAKTEKRGIQLRLEIQQSLHSVHGDKFLLRQALENLIINALDFSHAGGTIDVILLSSTHEAKIIVRDHGAGIPEFAEARIFERFYSTPRPDGARSSGLGLNFVREVTKLHGGECSVQNHSDGGVEAVLRLPIS